MGDTLVIDTVGIKESVPGYSNLPHSDRMRITERLRLVTGTMTIRMMMAGALALVLAGGASVAAQQSADTGPLGALAPPNRATPRPRAPFDLTGVWLHAGGADNPFRFSPPPGFTLTPEAQVHYDAARSAQAEARSIATTSASAGRPGCRSS